jgi:hypothetical protein
LLFLEDEQKPFRIDRMLTHMRQAGCWTTLPASVRRNVRLYGGPDGCRVRDAVRRPAMRHPSPRTFERSRQRYPYPGAPVCWRIAGAARVARGSTEYRTHKTHTFAMSRRSSVL